MTNTMNKIYVIHTIFRLYAPLFYPDRDDTSSVDITNLPHVPMGERAAESDLADETFPCPIHACKCYLLLPENNVWLRCSVSRIQNSSDQVALFKSISHQASHLVTIT